MYTNAVALLGLSALAAAKSSSFSSVASTTASSVTSAATNGTGPQVNELHVGGGSGRHHGGHSTSIGNQFPSPFPNVVKDSPQQTSIEEAALGTLPSGNPPPPTPKEDSLISLGFIAFNELFEVAFFTELIGNITSHKMGYNKIANVEEVLRVLKVVQAQEELHELNANGAFKTFTGNSIEPCKYDFPVDTFEDAIALASTFTDVVLSTLPDIQTIFALQNDTGLIRGVGSVIGQEGEQNGFYHQILGQVPPQLPFLTGGARDFAFNAILQNFVVPGSCPNVDLLVASKNGKGVGLRTIDTLTLLTDQSELSIEEDSTIQFAAETSNAGLGNNFAVKPNTGSGLFLTYINQQNSPFSVKVKEVTGEAGPLKLSATFPGKSHDLNGLTIAAITRSDFTGTGASPDDVAQETLFGPALIEVNQKI